MCIKKIPALCGANSKSGGFVNRKFTMRRCFRVVLFTIKAFY
jgi:hypothetical protein